MADGPEMLALDEVAIRVHVAAARLRLWCATGLLRCERLDHDWVVPAETLDEVQRLADAHGRRSPAGARLVAIGAMFTSAEAAAKTTDRIRQSGLAVKDVATAPIAVDQVNGVLVGFTVAAADLEQVASVVERNGGTLIAELRADQTGA